MLNCRHSIDENNYSNASHKANTHNTPVQKTNLQHLDEDYTCESALFSSLLEEIPNQDSNAYKITITSKENNISFSKLLDTRPQGSHINYCNDLYTVVGFPCGGPCYSRVFVFTDKNRHIEQYSYAQEVKNNTSIIAYIKDEAFENLIIHNFLNDKELFIDISDMNYWVYGQADSLIFQNENLLLHYASIDNEFVTKEVSLKSIL